jgi:tRNA-2-methylthio-N6-dimethylallyladenosine synthase
MINKYKIITFGCQMNLADSGLLGALLESRGYRAAFDEEDADLIILNTCSVREKAERRVFGRLSELSRLKKNGRCVRIAVVGCMAQRLGQTICRKAPQVDLVLGTDRLFELPEYLQNGFALPVIDTAFGYKYIEGLIPSRDNKYSGFVTISRGCDNYCTYCVVPYVRGPERSFPAGRIIDQVKNLMSDGALEITLLGQNVNSYNDHGIDFPELVTMIARETDIRRIRFMTSHPRDMSDRLIEKISSEPKLMPHVHLPLQSGSDRILAKMGRQYSFDHYRSLVVTLRAARPELSLTTDLIVGFPSESVQEYEMTLEAVRTIAFDSAFMFRYSVREGTAAAALADDIPESEKIRRLVGLINLQKETCLLKNQAEIGKIRSVLVDGLSRRSEKVLKGKTEGNKTILFAGGPELIGAIRKVRVCRADSWTLHGELV